MAKAKATRKSKKKAPTVSRYDVLRSLIYQYAEAHEADSWKGGGDPADVPVIEANLALAYARMNRHIEDMERHDNA